ncbi:MAG TPA: ABC-F family ATP-binding cassette domain-containing protein, partial [Rhizomicrobium sp.]|nr:ABC-F family ATP-binding cassette domain-containing protein [Rhizomicrobium sp.]
LHLEHGKLTLYTGGYDTFSETRAARRALDVAFQKKQDLRRKHLQSFVDRFRAKASKARQAQSRMKMIEKLESVDIPLDEHVAPIRIPLAAEASPPLITMENVSVGYEPGKPILSRIHLRFDPQDRIALLGKNGNGKSTLAKMIAEKLPVMGGEMVRAKKLTIGYFAQHQLEELDGSMTPIETLAVFRPKMNQTELRTQLGGFGLPADKQLTKVGNLSGGERARLMLALATLDKPNVLILDEPTNHLDIDARSELLAALNDFNGAVILVSHDRRLLESTADQLWLVADGQVRQFEGDLDDYRRFLLSGDNAPTQRVEAAAGVAEAPKQTKEEARRDAAEKRRRLKPLKDNVDAAEHEIAALNTEIAKYDRVLADPLIFNQDPQKAKNVSKKRADAVKKLADLETRWMKMQEEYESAMAG